MQGSWQRSVLMSFIAAVLGCALTARSQTTAPALQRDPGAILQQLRRITDELNLSADQQSQRDTLFARAETDLQEMRTELEQEDPAQRQDHVREFMTDLGGQIAEMLNADQRGEFQSKIAALRARASGNAATRPSTQPATSDPRPRRTSGGGFGGGFGGERPGQRLQENLGKLDLSPDQKTRVEAAAQKLKQTLAQIGFGQDADRRQNRQAALEAFRGSLAEILTPDQQAQLRQLMSESPSAGQGVSRNPPRPANPISAPTTVPSALASPVVDSGDAAPDFKLTELNGQSVSLASFKNRVGVLIFASYSSPLFRQRAASIEELRRQFGGQGVVFLLVYTKEAYPAGGPEIQRNRDDDIQVTQPTDMAARTAQARTTQQRLKLTIPIAPDTMDDHVASAYGATPLGSAVVIARNGLIADRQNYLEASGLSRMIADALIAGAK